MRTRKKQKQSVLVSLPSERSLGREPIFGGLLGPTAGGLDREDLELVRDVLNGWKLQELQPELIRLVDLWQRSGPNLTRMVKAAEPGSPKVGDPFPFSLSEVVNRSCKVTWMPTEGGNARLLFEITPLIKKRLFARNDPVTINKATATVLFALLTLNPEWDKLAGPCPRCGDYYIKKRTSQTVYCSRRCGNAATAVVRTREKLDEEHADKLRRAKEAAQKWTTARTEHDWKKWVHRKEPDITPKFLTRAVNKGELRVPVHQ